MDISYSCGNFSGSVRDVDLAYSGRKPDELNFEGTDGCGKTTKLSGVIDSLSVYKDGEKVTENFNTEIKKGAFSLGQLPEGNYTVEAKRGDTVKVMSISVPKRKDNQALILLVLIILSGAGLEIFFRVRWGQKRRKKS